MKFASHKGNRDSTLESDGDFALASRVLVRASKVPSLARILHRS